MVKKRHSYFAIILLFVFTACKNEPTLNDLIPCENNSSFSHTKTMADAKNDYQIQLGKNWKTELYLDENQSRIYSADTTRSYSESFIIDITRFEGNITLNEGFRQHLLSQIKSIPRAYIIKEGFVKFQENNVYAVYSFQKTDEMIFYNIQCYIANRKHYYLLESKINGNKNLDRNVCESLAVFNSLSQNLKQ